MMKNSEKRTLQDLNDIIIKKICLFLNISERNKIVMRINNKKLFKALLYSSNK